MLSWIKYLFIIILTSLTSNIQETLSHEWAREIEKEREKEQQYVYRRQRNASLRIEGVWVYIVEEYLGEMSTDQQHSTSYIPSFLCEGHTYKFQCANQFIHFNFKLK